MGHSHHLQAACCVQDQVDTIRSICIGISAHQKLELLSSLVKLLGYESLAVFGDCFDEASSLSLALWSEAVNVCAYSCSVITSLLCLSAVMQLWLGCSRYVSWLVFSSCAKLLLVLLDLVSHM